MENKDELVAELWKKRCSLVKQRIHANTLPKKVSEGERSRLWVRICEVDLKLSELGVNL